MPIFFSASSSKFTNIFQGKLTGADTALARWLVYAHTHVDLPLDYRVFLPILEKLRYAIATNLFLQEEVNSKASNSKYVFESCKNVKSPVMSSSFVPHWLKWTFFSGTSYSLYQCLPTFRVRGAPTNNIQQRLPYFLRLIQL